MFVVRPQLSIVPALEGKASRSSHTNLSIISELSSKSGVSSISELSLQTGPSAVSHVSPANTRVSRTRRPSRSRRKSRSSFRSEVYRPVRSSMSSRLSRSDLNRRKLSAPSRTTTHFFIRNSYLWNSSVGITGNNEVDKNSVLHYANRIFQMLLAFKATL